MSLSNKRKVKLTITLEPEVKEKLKSSSKMTDRSLSYLINMLIKKYL